MLSHAVRNAAIRALEDHDFAQKVLTGEEDYPEIRDAILADLFESTHIERKSKTAEGVSEEIEVETRFIDAGPRFSPMGPCYVKYYPKMAAMDWHQHWNEMQRPNLRRVAEAKPD